MVKICVRYKNYYFQCELHLFNFESDFVQFLAAGDPTYHPIRMAINFRYFRHLASPKAPTVGSAGHKIKKFSGI